MAMFSSQVFLVSSSNILPMLPPPSTCLPASPLVIVCLTPEPLF